MDKYINIYIYTYIHQIQPIATEASFQASVTLIIIHTVRIECCIDELGGTGQSREAYQIAGGEWETRWYISGTTRDTLSHFPARAAIRGQVALEKKIKSKKNN